MAEVNGLAVDRNVSEIFNASTGKRNHALKPVETGFGGHIFGRPEEKADF